MRLYVLSAAILAVVGCVVAASVWAADCEAKKPNLGKLRHVVIFKFKDGTTPEQIKTIEDAFRHCRRRFRRSSTSSGAPTTAPSTTPKALPIAFS